MRPDLDDEATPKETGVPVYNARLVAILLVLGFLNILQVEKKIGVS
jgi:hypothetical protein